MTFAPTQQSPIGTISEVLAKSILQNVENDGDHTYLHIQEESKSQLPINTETKNCRTSIPCIPFWSPLEKERSR